MAEYGYKYIINIVSPVIDVNLCKAESVHFSDSQEHFDERSSSALPDHKGT